MADPVDERSLAALRTRYDAARTADHGSPAARQRHVDAACALVIALVDELEEDAADGVLAATLPLTAHDARLEVTTRRHLARELAGLHAWERALAQLRAAEACARDSALSELERDVASELAAVLAKHQGGDEPSQLVSSTSALQASAQRVRDPELASAMERSLATQVTGDEAVAHARKSLDHAQETVDPEVIAEATSLLCELLVERGELAEAKALLDGRPPTRDSRADRALYDQIRRQLGEHVPDPPEEPDAPAQPPPAVLAYLTKPLNAARWLGEGGLPGSAKIREWAAGAVAAAADLESEKIFRPVRSFWCGCGRFRGREYSGMSCGRCGVELVHASARRARIGYIVLEAPVVHPWYAATAGVLLDLTPEAVLALPIDALREQLARIDLDALVTRFKIEIVSAPKAKLADQAGRRLAIADAFRHAHAPFGTLPDSAILDVVLVAPPDGDLGFDRPLVRAAYAGILAAPADPRAVGALFDALARRPAR